MSRLNAFFQLIEEPQTPPWKKQHNNENKQQNKNFKAIKKLDAQEKQRLSVIQQKFASFLKFDQVIENDFDKDNDSSLNSSEEYPDDDEYNAFNLQDEESAMFNKIGIDAIMKALSKRKKSNFEVKLLSHALMHNPFFKKMRKQITETLYQDLFKEIYLETYSAMDTVFEFGDMGDKFYIILQGDVYILSPSQLGIALQQIEKEKEQLALEKLKSENITTSQHQKNSITLNLNRILSDRIGEQISSRNSPRKSTGNNGTEEDESASATQSPRQQIKRQKEDLRKYAINKHHTQQKLNDSFSSVASLDQTPQNDNQGNTSPLKSRIGEKYFERRSSNSENRSRVSSFQSNSESINRSRNNSGSNEGQKIQRLTTEQKVYQKFPNFYIVKKLGVGDNFGEIALRTDKERTATVVCKSNCKFAVISKSGFQRILGEFFKAQMEEKEQFLQSLNLFKGYNFTFLANILMNIKKKIFNFDDIIYDEGQENNKIYFIKSGEVELSKKVDTHNHDIQQGQNEFKKNERVVMAQKQPNEWFGEVEIMQNIKRFTRARCVSAKLEVFYISAIKFFANLNIEEIITDLKKSSSMIDHWRQKHYNTMVNRIYKSKRDPLRKTFENMQVAHDLINEKFKKEFMKVNPQQIIQPNKIEETSLAAKIVYFNTVKTYVSKISDVIGTISKMKHNQENHKKEEEIKQQMEIQKRKQQQLRSQSLPRYLLNQSQINGNTIAHKRISSLYPSEVNSPIKLPKLPLLSEYYDEGKRKSNLTVETNKSQHSINLNKSQIGLENEKLPQFYSPQVRQLSQQHIQQNQTPQTTDREKFAPSLFSSPSHQKIKLSLNKKINSNLGSQNEFEEFTGRNSITQIYPITTPHTSCTLNQIQMSKAQITDRISTDQEFLENLYDGIVHNKSTKQLMFNKEMNQKIIDEGLRKKNLQLHQSKQHGEDFTNLLNRLATKAGINDEDNGNDKAKKLKLFKKLKLDNILDYKYLNQKRIQQAQVKNSQQTETSRKTEKIETLHSRIHQKKFLDNQITLIPKTFQSKIIPSKSKLSSAISLSQLNSPISKSLVNKQVIQHGIPQHHLKK